MDKPLIQIENLSKTFSPGFPVLKNLNFTLPQNQMIGLVGPDGAGKTTLLRLIAALLLPTTGKIEVLGADTLLDADKIHSFSSYMPQRFGLYEDLTVQQNLELYAELKGLPRELRKETFEKLFSFTGLAPFSSRLAGNLSGGMKQKLGLACALINKPQFLILDEPSVGVDPLSRIELWKMVQSLLAEGVSVLWSTTYLDEAEKCDRIVLLNGGELFYEGVPKNLTQRVDGRVFRVEDISLQRREHLAVLENREDVVDALIQGSDIRVVAKEKAFDQGTATTSRLEDAFIDLLGGKTKGESALSKAAPRSLGEREEMVVAKGLVKRFGSFTAVDRVSFSVHRGEIFGLLGPNGAGKSTTFKMLCGLLNPTEGSAEVDGFDLQKASIEARSKIGYMAQKFSLYGNLTVLQNMEFFSRIYSIEGTAKEKLTLFGLDSYQNITAESLPLGYKQRLGLAVAVAHWPEVLFLDEPTSGMDPVSRRQFWSEMNELVRKGKTILVSTHFMDEAENCDRIGLIYKGMMIHLDTPSKLKEIARTKENQNPTLENAFIELIRGYDAKHE